MKTFVKITLTAAVFTLMSAMPLMGQIVNGLSFKASAPFYAGNSKFPAGAYTITQSSIDNNELLIQSTGSEKYSAFFDAIATQSEQPHAKTEVTFHKYGSTDYLSRVWIQGQQYGLQAEETKAEKKAAAAGAPVEHSVPGTKL